MPLPRNTFAAVRHAASATSAVILNPSALARSKTSLALFALFARAMSCVAGASLRAARREPGKIDFATARMEIEKALAELGHFGKASGDRHFGDLVRAQIFQHAAYKIAHLDQRDVRQSMQHLDRRFRSRAGRSGDMGKPGGAGDIDPAMNRVDPCGAGIGHDNPRGAQDREAADDAEPPVQRSLCDFFAAWNRDFDGHVSGKTIKARHLADRGLDHSAGHRIDGGLSRRQGKSSAGNCANSLSGAKHHARSGRAVRHARDHQRAMGHVGIVARILNDSRTGKTLSKFLESQREGRPRATRQGDRDDGGKFTANERLIGRPRGGGGAGAGRPALPQIRLAGRALLGFAHCTWNRLLVKPAGHDGNDSSTRPCDCRAALGQRQDHAHPWPPALLPERGPRCGRRQMRSGLYRSGISCRCNGQSKLQSGQLGDDSGAARLGWPLPRARLANSFFAKASWGYSTASRESLAAPVRPPTWRQRSAGRSCSCSTPADNRKQRRRSCKAAPALTRA